MLNNRGEGQMLRMLMFAVYILKSSVKKYIKQALYKYILKKIRK